MMYIPKKNLFPLLFNIQFLSDFLGRLILIFTLYVCLSFSVTLTVMSSVAYVLLAVIASDLSEVRYTVLYDQEVVTHFI